VCRVLDYSKYKYELAQKQKAARKHQKQIVIREIKFRPKIAEHDYATKKGHVQRFLRHRDKVKITIMFRGREQSHPERGKMILDRLASELEDLAQIEQRPNLEGRNMTMVLGPSKAVLKGDFDDKPGGEAPADGDAVADVDADAPEVATEVAADATPAAEAPEAEAVEAAAPEAEAPAAEAAPDDASADAEAPADAPADAEAPA
jgi:translation initiation factor IF-3